MCRVLNVNKSEKYLTVNATRSTKQELTYSIEKMAFNPNPDAVFTPGKVNFIKVSELLLGLGRTIIRELFDLQVPPTNLVARLQVLRSTRPMGFWTRDESNVLFPSTGIAVSSASFDISLLCKLFREIGNLPPHRWDQPLDPSDHSLAAEIRRAKNYRNQLAHHGTMELDDHHFNTFWNEIKALLLRTVQLTPPQQTADDRVRKWKTAIDKLYSKNVIETDREWARQLLEFTEVVIEFTTTLASSGAWLVGNERILNRYNADPDILRALVQEVVLPLGMEVFGFLTGSVKIVIWTREPKALEEFWRRYQTGQLKKDLETVLITEEWKQLANGDAVELEVTVSKEEYRKAHKYLTGEDKEELELESFGEKPFSEKVSGSIIQMLSNSLGEDWKPLSRHLRVSLDDIDVLEKKMSNDEIARNLLLKWTQTEGNTATRSKLIEALKMIGRFDLVDNVVMEYPDD